MNSDKEKSQLGHSSWDFCLGKAPKTDLPGGARSTPGNQVLVEFLIMKKIEITSEEKTKIKLEIPSLKDEKKNREPINFKRKRLLKRT